MLDLRTAVGFPCVVVSRMEPSVLRQGPDPDTLDPLTQTISSDQSLMYHIVEARLSSETQPSARLSRQSHCSNEDKLRRQAGHTRRQQKLPEVSLHLRIREWLCSARCRWRCTSQCKDHASQYHPGIAIPSCGCEDVAQAKTRTHEFLRVC